MSVAGPSAQVRSAVAFDHVDHYVPLQIDQTGGIDDRIRRGGGQERRLIDPQLPHPTDPVRVIDQRNAVLLSSRGGVAAGRVIERFDPFEDGLGESGPCRPVRPVEQLALQESEEGLGDGVVQRVADGAYGAEQAGAPEALPEDP